MLKSGCVCDLRVKVEKPSVVYPAEATERRSLFLSNIDQVLVFTLETLHFFAANPQKYSSEDVVEVIKGALSKLLVHYDFAAGRLKLNVAQKRLEVDCNGAGALFAAASSEQSLEELGDITCPNPSFRQLILQEYQGQKLEDLPLCFLQVTRFKCGGFAIGLGINHTILDGIAIVNFLRNLASLAAGDGMAVPPFCDRNLLRARSPPRVEFKHPELIRVEEISDKAATFGNGADSTEADDIISPVQPPNNGNYVFELFRVDNQMLKRIKAKAMEDGRVKKCSGFEAVTAHVWRCRTIAMEMGGEKTSSVLFAVDVRGRMKPPLPSEYAGNAVLFAYASATAREIEEEGGVSVCVEKVQEGVGRMSDGYIRSVIDWGEVYTGVPCTEGGFALSSWWRLGFEEVEYPWGKAVYCGPGIHGRGDIVLFLPTLNNNKNAGHDERKEDGVNVFLALKSRQMHKFAEIFNGI
eukprot:Gb_28530 [translate_table: standard]